MSLFPIFEIYPHFPTAAGRLANICHCILDTYLLVDRDAKSPSNTLPSNSSPLPPSPHALSEITNLSPASSQSSTPSLTRSPTKTSSIPPLQLDPDSFPFKSKLFMPVFNDLQYLIHTDPVEALIRWYVLLSLYRFTHSLATLSLSISDFGFLCLPSICRLPLW